MQCESKESPLPRRAQSVRHA